MYQKPQKYLKSKNIGSRLEGCCIHCSESILLSFNTPNIEFNGGQRLFFCSTGCRAKLLDSPFSALKATTAESYKKENGMVPSMLGYLVKCPMCSTLEVVSHNTPRVSMNHGQCIFMHSFPCISSMLSSEVSFMSCMPNAIRDGTNAQKELTKPTQTADEELGTDNESSEVTASIAKMELGKSDKSGRVVEIH